MKKCFKCGYSEGRNTTNIVEYMSRCAMCGNMNEIIHICYSCYFNSDKTGICLTCKRDLKIKELLK